MPPSSTSSKALAWFALLTAALLLLTPFHLAFVADAFVSFDLLGLYLLSAVLFGIAGAYCLQQRSWAFWLLTMLLAVQAAEVRAAAWGFSLIGPISLKFGATWSDPTLTVNFNVLAILLAVVAANIAVDLSRSIDPLADLQVPQPPSVA